MPGPSIDRIQVGAEHDDVVRVAVRGLADDADALPRAHGGRDEQVDVVTRRRGIGQRQPDVPGRPDHGDVQPVGIDQGRSADLVRTPLRVRDDERGGARGLGMIDDRPHPARPGLDEDDRARRNAGPAGRLAARAVAVAGLCVPVEVEREHRRGHLARRRQEHGLEVARALEGRRARRPDLEHPGVVLLEQRQRDRVEGDVVAGAAELVGHPIGRGRVPVAAGRPRAAMLRRDAAETVEVGQEGVRVDAVAEGRRELRHGRCRRRVARCRPAPRDWRRPADRARVRCGAAGRPGARRGRARSRHARGGPGSAGRRRRWRRWRSSIDPSLRAAAGPRQEADVPSSPASGHGVAINPARRP